jgi:hypothetical protein
MDRSDQELLDGVFAAVTREFEDVALVVAHIAEMDKRKLFAGEARNEGISSSITSSRLHGEAKRR